MNLRAQRLPDQLKQLDVEAVGSPNEVAAFYKTALAPGGWTATTTNPVRDRTQSFMIFRNHQKDMLALDMRELKENKTRVSLKHQWAQEVEELDRRLELAVQERKRKEDEERNGPKPKITLGLPAGAQDVEARPEQIEFQLSSGQAKAVLAAISKELTEADWKTEESLGEAAAGQLSFNKGEQTVSILYVDPGFIPGQITISGSGVELEQKAK
jgi:hypothetical protein